MYVGPKNGHGVRQPVKRFCQLKMAIVCQLKRVSVRQDKEASIFQTKMTSVCQIKIVSVCQLNIAIVCQLKRFSVGHPKMTSFCQHKKFLCYFIVPHLLLFHLKHNGFLSLTNTVALNIDVYKRGCGTME